MCTWIPIDVTCINVIVPYAWASKLVEIDLVSVGDIRPFSCSLVGHGGLSPETDYRQDV